MTTQRSTRRPRGSVREPVVVALRIEQASRHKFAAAAKASGMSMAAVFDLLVEHMPVDENGVLEWVREEQLPIERAS